jgi:hypothetical protein
VLAVNRIAVVVLVVALGIPGAAAADPDPAPVAVIAVAEPPRALEPVPEFGAFGAFGYGGQKDGARGWAARIEYEYLFARQRPGLMVGYGGGLEVWRSGADNWGFSLPLAIQLGAHAGPADLTVGGGFDYFLVDQVDDDTGFGLFAPFAMARFGLEVAGVRVGVDTRYGYHWQFGAESHARWSLTFFVGGRVPMRAN